MDKILHDRSIIGERVRRIRAADWRDAWGEHTFDIVPTASADPELSSRVPGGPLYATYQWHRSVFYDDPDLDA
jgi:hypothetical protein